MKSILKYILIFIIASLISCYGGDSDNNDASYQNRYPYYTYEEIVIFLEETAANYPAIAKLEKVGYSVSGRVIKALIISDNPADLEGEPAIRLTGGIHGNEMMSMELLIRFIEYLTSNYDSDSEVRRIVDNRYICIIPVLNPDGLERNRRYNDKNIDLNRNFNATGNELQIETKSLQDYSLKKNFILSVTYHVGQVLVNIPFDYASESKGGDVPAENDLVKYFAKAYTQGGSFLENPDLYKSHFMKDGVINGGDWYVIQGSLQDWSYLKTGCLDLTIEVSNRNPATESGVEQVFMYNRDSLMAFIDKADQGVYGKVTNSSNEPVSDVKIIASWGDNITGDIVIKTDKKGYYNRILLPGTYKLKFTKPSYNEIEETITVIDRVEKNIVIGF